ncbi:MAG: 16S rRNA (cytosine(1402)-N(4))-methyltransferase RsmH [Nitriliruptoraceae bacterium]
MTAAPHTPVLLDRVVELLTETPDGPIVDATVGAGGHARAIVEARLARYGRAQLLGLDRDPDALALATARLADLAADARVEVTLVRTRFDALGAVLDDAGIAQVSGVLLDLGISSMHVDRPERGFSFRADGPLDMRMDPALPTTAAEMLDDLDEVELTRLLQRYGEEPHARRIARAIVAARPITTTAQLAEVVRAAVPAAARRRAGHHPATRTFQALRIAVNAELEALEAVLPVALERLGPGGVAVVLAYHSLEDRLVKRAFAAAAATCTCPPGLPVCVCGTSPLVTPLVRRPERPGPEEIAANPRATAARLRAARRLLQEHP